MANNNNGVDASLLRRALRLVHCLQKERGASCAFVASNNDQKTLLDLFPARSDTDRAVGMLLLEQKNHDDKAKHSGGNRSPHEVIRVSLDKIRKMLERDDETSQSNSDHNEDSKIQSGASYHHRIFMCFNTLISAVLHDFVLGQNRRKDNRTTGHGDDERKEEKVNKPKKSLGGMHRVRSHQSIESLSATSAPRHRRNLSDGDDGGGADEEEKRNGGRYRRNRTPSDPSGVFMAAVAEEKMKLMQPLPRIPSNGSDISSSNSKSSSLMLAGKESFEDDEIDGKKDSHSDAASATSSRVSFWLPEEDEDNANEVMMVQLDLLDVFVALKESTGRERAILSSILVAGQNEAAQYMLNDLVIEVENQKRRLEQLSTFKKTSLSKIINELITLSPFMENLQSRILSGAATGHLDKSVFSTQELWDMLTIYIDKLHSLELLIVEELECTAFSGEQETEHVQDGERFPLGNNGSMVVDLGQQDDALKRVFGDKHGLESKADLRQEVEALSPEQSKSLLLSLLKQSSTSQQQPESPPRNGIASDIKDSPDAIPVVSTEELPNRLDKLLCELTSAPPSKEWEIDLYKVKFLKRIGQGTAGTTYLGEWEGSRIAVKVAAISEMGLEGWRTEAKALQKLHHPNIIRLLGSVYHPDPVTFCLVLEYCSGGDLSDAMVRATPKNFFMRSALGIAKGIAYLHDRGIIHRDVKPSNVLLDGNVTSGNFQVKVTDFGVSTESSVSKDRTAETGTYRWMAPEVIRHETYDKPADVYSFAIVLWQLITRETPFDDKSTFDAAAMVAMEQKRPPFPEGTPPAIRKLIETCWVNKPDDRPQFHDIIQSLTELEKELTEEEMEWLEAPLGHKVYFPPSPIPTTAKKAPKQVKLQIPVIPGAVSPTGGKERKKVEKRRFGLFSRKSSYF